MVRKSSTAAQSNIPEGIPSGHAVTLAEEQTIRAVQDGYTEDRDLMNQLMGQIQMANAIGKLTTVVGLTKLQHIKENKLYRAFSGKTIQIAEGEKITDVGTWDGFCRLIGSSQQKVDEDLLNLRTFGEEAMQQLSSVGAGYRDLRKLRALPAEERGNLLESPELKQALAEGDKDTLRELIEDMAVSHAKKEAALQGRVNELEADQEANDRVIKEKEKKLDALAKKLKKMETATDPWPEKIHALKDEIGKIGNVTDECLGKVAVLLTATTAMTDQMDEEGVKAAESVILRLEETIARVCNMAAELRNAFDTDLSAYVSEVRSHQLEAS
ncbi:hypothetical protein AZSI13_32530 [Azospira sp. I13]|uniref:hypothetical protein n=1 Tax=Azospira sp. I13 TaxID=1765050 RepID=UPI000D47D1FA|nr:hypothetical protein [Azospira sp. I13]GBG03926.1 hypothetical protein AZSI13_32530 [Azospira sp. I13]